MEFQEIVYAEDGPVGTITLNRPDDGNTFAPRWMLPACPNTACPSTIWSCPNFR